MRRDHRVSAEIDEKGPDNESEDAGEARQSVGGPYRDRRDALVERRRGIAREHAEAERAAHRRERLARHLEVIDGELREATARWLDGLEIARPCGARWEDMIGDDTSRRCGRCDRDVHDLARMTEAEIHALFARAEASPCVRLRRRADGRVVTADCPPDAPRALPRALRVVAAGVLFGASAGATATLTMMPCLGGARPARETVYAGGRAPGAAPPVARVAPNAPTGRVAARDVPEVHVDALAAGAEPAEGARDDAMMGAVALPSPAAITSEDLDAHVRWIAPQAWEIDRAIVERALQQVDLHGGSRFVPHERGGRVVGVRIYGVRPGSGLARLGIENGDTLLDVNGYEVAIPDRALEAYARLRGTDALFVRLERRGEERMHVYRIVD